MNSRMDMLNIIKIIKHIYLYIILFISNISLSVVCLKIEYRYIVINILLKGINSSVKSEGIIFSSEGKAVLSKKTYCRIQNRIISVLIISFFDINRYATSNE